MNNLSNTAVSKAPSQIETSDLNGVYCGPLHCSEVSATLQSAKKTVRHFITLDNRYRFSFS
jgi:hypothetical protein